MKSDLNNTCLYLTFYRMILAKNYKLLVMSLAFIYVIGISTFFFNNHDLQWEWLNFAAAQGVINTGIPEISQLNGVLYIDHPPVTPYIIALSIKIFGNSIWAARFPGLIFFLATSILIYQLSRICKLPDCVAVISSIVYMTNPLVLQGALAIDFSDTAICPFLSCLFICNYLRDNAQNIIKQGALSGFILALLLFSKIPNGIIMTIALIIVCMLDHDKNRKKLLLSTMISCIFFVVTIWVSYCGYVHLRRIDLPFMKIVVTPIEYVMSDSSVVAFWHFNGPIMVLFLYVLSFAVYVGPAYMFFGLISIPCWSLDKIKRLHTSKYDIIPVFCIGIILAYSIYLGGGLGGYKKYFSPCIPLMPILFFRRFKFPLMNINVKEIKFFAIFMVASLLYFLFLVGDPVFVLNVESRIVRYLGDNRLGLLIFAMTFLLYLVPFMTILLSRRFINVSTASVLLLLLIIASQVSVTVHQAWGGYGTRYIYGISNSDIANVNARLADGNRSIMGLQFFSILGKARIFVDDDYQLWQSSQRIYKFVGEKNPDFIVYGYCTHQIYQVTMIENDCELQRYLRNNYRLYKYDTIWLWSRRSKPLSLGYECKSL